MQLTCHGHLVVKISWLLPPVSDIVSAMFRSILSSWCPGPPPHILRRMASMSTNLVTSACWSLGKVGATGSLDSQLNRMSRLLWVFRQLERWIPSPLYQLMQLALPAQEEPNRLHCFAMRMPKPNLRTETGFEKWEAVVSIGANQTQQDHINLEP